ncbi:MAG: 50S ribosomal protein L25 [Candidatus Jorgensenbacteria bacterium]|nr:50S ribosomal protein L25 [Candidatus Jorgensenbacteria bacterium]
MTELKVHNRTVFGKKIRTLRREGSIPAEIYGHGIPNQHVAVSTKEFVALYRTAGSHTVITLVGSEGKIPAIIAEVAQNPLSDEILAVDFHAIRKDEKIRAKVPLTLVGTAPAAKAGFIIVEVVHELEIEALPENLLHKIEVPIEKLEKPGDSVAVKDLSLPSTVKLHVPPDAVLVTVREHVKEAAPPPPAAEAIAPGTTTEGTTPATGETESPAPGASGPARPAGGPAAKDAKKK